MPKVVVEFYGTARHVTGQKEVPLELKEGSTFRDVVKTLAARYPALIGDVIKPSGDELQMPNMFNVNARRVVQDLDTQPEDGDRILLMFVTAGG
ncbi:MAG: MoaD/ThiS family protein [Anaerolineae bacterium]|nr:MoaD/ThiS family protein [Anaerolineae bacterium]